jgi:hypothetical protein
MMDMKWVRYQTIHRVRSLVRMVVFRTSHHAMTVFIMLMLLNGFTLSSWGSNCCCTYAHGHILDHAVQDYELR